MQANRAEGMRVVEDEGPQGVRSRVWRSGQMIGEAVMRDGEPLVWLRHPPDPAVRPPGR